MSRREIRLQNKRHIKKILLFLMCAIVFLSVGILAVDYAVRDMLGLYDTRVLGIETLEEEFVIYIFGDTRYIEREAVEEKIDNIRQQLYIIWRRIKNVGENRHFF